MKKDNLVFIENYRTYEENSNNEIYECKIIFYEDYIKKLSNEYENMDMKYPFRFGRRIMPKIDRIKFDKIARLLNGLERWELKDFENEYTYFNFDWTD